MHKKIQIVAFILFCAMLVVYSLRTSQELYSNCDKCNFFYQYR
jgi:hypothetical protein